VTGHDGYIGSIMVPTLEKEGFEVIGADSFFFADCSFRKIKAPRKFVRIDIRDLTSRHFEDVEAIVHLAATSQCI